MAPHVVPLLFSAPLDATEIQPPVTVNASAMAIAAICIQDITSGSLCPEPTPGFGPPRRFDAKKGSAKAFGPDPPPKMFNICNQNVFNIQESSDLITLHILKFHTTHLP